MRPAAVSATIALLTPCCAPVAATTATLRDEEPGLPPAFARLAAKPGRSVATPVPRMRARSPPASSGRRLDEDIKLCDFVLNFTAHVITTRADGAQSVVAADLDGDSRLDVLSASLGDDTIAWYENMDGTAILSGPQRVITTQADFALSVAAADIDGDGDLDVLSASSTDDKIAWYENLDGSGDFSGPQLVITTSASGARSVAAVDLDGDGDFDVLSASTNDDKIAWYENLDGAGDFSGPERMITTEADDVQSIAAADLDGDGDLDVLSASFTDNKIAWYENLDGAGDFSGPQRIITTEATGARLVAAADLDGDGDLDVLSASFDDSKIAWYENLDGAGDFSGPNRVITTQANGARSVAAADLDNDGDLDVMSASFRDDKIAWYENLDGAGDFSGPQRVITTQADGATAVVAADLDNDGDLDVLSASYIDDKIAWYENQCEPMTPQPTLQPTPEPTYWGPQVFGKKPQTAGFQRLCVAWCIIFGFISFVVLGYVVHTSQHRDKNLARVICTIFFAQCDYGSDTLFIGFQNFVTPTIFFASLITYHLPLAVFIFVYRRMVRKHIENIITLTKAKTIVRFDSWDELAKAIIEIGSFVLFAFAFAVSAFAYLMLLFLFVSCKLMSVSFFAVAFFDAGGIQCTQEDFEAMFKRSLLSEIVFESSGQLIIILVDTSLRAQKNQSNTDLSSWAVLSIIGSSLMLVVQFWPYVYHILWKRRGLEAGIAAVSTNLKFMPHEDLAPKISEWFVSLAGSVASRGQTVNNDSEDNIVETTGPREQ